MASVYLTYPTFAAAQARSHTQALALGCSNGTQFWWACYSGPSGQGALQIVSGSPYFDVTTQNVFTGGVQTGLSAGEQSSLQAAAAMIGWTLPS